MTTMPQLTEEDHEFWAVSCPECNLTTTYGWGDVYELSGWTYVDCKRCSRLIAICEL